MSFRNFILGLSASFGLAWLCVVVVPFFKMRDLAAIPLGDGTEEDAGFYYPKRAGRIADGARVYAENGCYLCHTQVIRPTYAGNDMFRPDWAGFISEEGDTRRETNAFDFFGEKYAQIGVSRMGPDLSNLAYRVEADKFRTVSPETWLYVHLYDSRIFAERRKSNCPPMPFLFEKNELVGVRSADALPVGDQARYEITPNPDARALVSYLLSLKKDQAVPPALNFAPVTAEAGN